MGVDRREGTAQGRRILVIANETVTGVVLHEAIRFRARNVGGEVLVVAPAIDTRPRTPDGDAEPRLARSLDRLRAAGIDARGQIGDGDPMQAIADALEQFAADEIIVATHPERRSGWLGHELVARARVRFDLPVLHLVVDLERQREHGDAPRVLTRTRRAPRRPSPTTPPPTPTAS
jgi:GABA permease